ncbi:TIR domain-containing protein [Rhodospirillaceae bacterium AH-315-P19]|nr:TIR domain-containing protein [Rhodospirillaceae bacterium AH-315-P19]
MSSKYYLPSKIISYLKRLEIEYGQFDNAILSEVVKNARVCVREEASYDNWNGGTYGHDVLFFLPPPTLGKIQLKKQDEYRQRICEDLNTCAQSIENEFVNDVSFEYEDENDPEYQQSVSIKGRVQINPDTLSIWNPGQIRLFISHRDVHKVAAKELAEALEAYGISAFVAHDTIEPMTTWQAEIVKGLETMEIMLAFVTKDFHESIWTNQEIGFALGRNIPVVSLKLQNRDPSGFIGSLQALRGRLENPVASVPEIYKLLAEKLGNKERLQSALIGAFLTSPDFSETKLRFDRMEAVIKTLSEGEVLEIIRGFRENDQLHKAGHLTSKYQRLTKFLNRTTGKEYVIKGADVVPQKEAETDEIPF